MAGRQNKVGLDYFELDCHMDEKVELIEAEYGLKGFAIIVKLYQGIYSGLGYYCEWTPDISVLWARRLGVSHGVGFGDVGKVDENSCALPGFPNNLINNIVAALIRRNIFSEKLFTRYGILTSSGVQKQYLKATSKREMVELKKEYILISIPENRKNVVINSISSVGNEQSKEEKRREEESREKKNKKEPHTYYPNDEKLNQAFIDFADMRRQIKKPLTDRAVTLTMNKLKDLAVTPFGEMDNDLAIKILEQSVVNCWASIYPLKTADSGSNKGIDWSKV